MEEVYNKLIKYIPEDRVLLNEPMSKHTTFKIGGPADIFIKINNLDELKFVLKFVKENNIPLNIIGNGSNILVRDRGIRGITIKLDMQNIDINGNQIKVGAGMLLPKLARIASENNLSGIEFACGIPGSVGGAIKMNSGAYGGEMSNIVISTTFLDEDGEIHIVSKEEQNFSYRDSIFNQNDKYIIVETTLQLHNSNKDEILKKMKDNNESRRTKQPINYPSAGSVFKRKNEFIPAEIIDKSGLKGYNVGDASISELHAGFIVNNGNATAKDVLNVVEHIKDVINKKYNIDLELEIKVIGE